MNCDAKLVSILKRDTSSQYFPLIDQLFNSSVGYYLDFIFFVEFPDQKALVRRRNARHFPPTILCDFWQVYNPAQ